MQVTRPLIMIGVLALVAGCAQKQPATLGAKPVDTSTVAIAKLAATKSPQTIEGAMIDKCPVAGCWFHVKDATGVIKVDTKNSGFVVTDVPLNSHVVVTGVYKSGDDKLLAATGMSFR